MGERNILRDIIFGALLVAVVVLLFLLLQQNEHDVAAHMQKIADTQAGQDQSLRALQETAQKQNDTLKDILAELKAAPRTTTVVVPSGQQPPTHTQTTPNGATTTNPPPNPPVPSKDDARAIWESRYVAPKAETGGTLYRSFTSDPGTLNPLTENDATVSDIHQFVSESLATRDYKNPDEWVPELATSWTATQTSWAIVKGADAQKLADKLSAGLPQDVKTWLKASVDADGRLRLDLQKQGDNYLKILADVLGGKLEDHFEPVQWVETKFLPEAGTEGLPEARKVLERFERTAKETKGFSLPGAQGWETEQGFAFRLRGELTAVETAVKTFLSQDEQKGPKGPVWTINKVESNLFEDKLYYTFKLRQGVKWHNGTPLTTKDYLFSFNALKDPGVDCQATRNYYQDCEELKALDADTIRFTWRKLFAGAFTASAGLTLLPEHIYAYKSANELNTHPRNKEAFGTGPYRFKEWIPKQRMVLERNEHYWGRKPNFERIQFRVIAESAVRLQLLKDKKLDLMGLTPAQWVNDTKKSPFGEANGLISVKQYGLYYSYLGWNARLPHLADKKVRQALTLSIDREKILRELLFGLGAVVSGTFYHKSPYTDPAIKPWPFDLEKAKALFAEAGWKDTDNDGFLDKDGKRFSVKIRFPAASETGKKVLVAVQSNLKDAGVHCDLDPIEWSVFLTRIKKRDFDGIMLGWSLGWDPDPYQLWHSSQAAGEGSNHCYFVNKEADQIIERLRKTMDLDERIRLCRRFHAILHDEQPYTFMFNSMGLVAHNAGLLNMYLPLAPGEERELYLPHVGDMIYSRFWFKPKAYQQAQE